MLVQRGCCSENLEAHFEHLQVCYGCDQSSETSFIFVKIQGDSLKHFEHLQVLKFWIELELWNEPQGFSGFYFKLWISSSGYQSPGGLFGEVADSDKAPGAALWPLLTQS